MQAFSKFERVLVKLSGEVLQKTDTRGINSEALSQVAQRIKDIVELDIELALVIGAGNLFRGLPASKKGNVRRETADYIGMLATVMNSLALRDALQSIGVEARVQSAIPMAGIVDCFDLPKAERELKAGHVVIFAGGTGHPYFTTDTTAALRACEIRAKAIIKATKVDGVYTADPQKDPQAKRFAQLSYTDALEQRLGIMDSTAFTLCMDNDIPILVLNFFASDDLKNILQGTLGNTTLVANCETKLSTKK